MSSRHDGIAAKKHSVLDLRLRNVPTNADIERFAAENPGYRIERDVDGTLVVSPTGSAGGLRNARLGAALFAWNKSFSQPGFCFDSLDRLRPDRRLTDRTGRRLDRPRSLDGAYR